MHSVKKALLAPLLALPFVTHAQWITSFGQGMLAIFSYLVPTLLGIALVVFIWGLVVFMSQGSDERAHEEGRRKMVWGVIILFVIVSMWGIVRLFMQIMGVKTGYVEAPYVEYTYEDPLP